MRPLAQCLHVRGIRCSHVALHVVTGRTHATCCQCAGQIAWGVLAARYDCGMLDWLTSLPRHSAWCPSCDCLRPHSITPSLPALARPQAAEGRPCQVPTWLHISSLQVIRSASVSPSTLCLSPSSPSASSLLLLANRQAPPYGSLTVPSPPYISRVHSPGHACLEALQRSGSSSLHAIGQEVCGWQSIVQTLSSGRGRLYDANMQYVACSLDYWFWDSIVLWQTFFVALGLVFATSLSSLFQLSIMLTHSDSRLCCPYACAPLSKSSNKTDPGMESSHFTASYTRTASLSDSYSSCLQQKIAQNAQSPETCRLMVFCKAAVHCIVYPSVMKSQLDIVHTSLI